MVICSLYVLSCIYVLVYCFKNHDFLSPFPSKQVSNHSLQQFYMTTRHFVIMITFQQVCKTKVLQDVLNRFFCLLQWRLTANCGDLLTSRADIKLWKALRFLWLIYCTRMNSGRTWIHHIVKHCRYDHKRRYLCSHGDQLNLPFVCTCAYGLRVSSHVQHR